MVSWSDRLGRTLGELSAGLDDERAYSHLGDLLGKVKASRGSGATLRVDVQTENADGTTRLAVDCRMPGVTSAPATDTVVRVSRTRDGVNFASTI